MNDYSDPCSSRETEYEASIRNAGWQRGVADERARCLKVLEDLRDSSQHSGAEWIAYRFAITALSNDASAPVGGEQR